MFNFSPWLDFNDKKISFLCRMAYPFQKWIDEQKHLDTDEFRHLIKPVIHHIPTDFAGMEHLYCDPSQLDANGKFIRPKLVIEAEQRGFATFTEMIEADKKAQEDEKQQQIDLLLKQGQELQALLATQQQQIASLTDILCQLKNR